MDNYDRFEAALHSVTARVEQLSQCYAARHLEKIVYADSEWAMSSYEAEFMSPMHCEAFEALLKFDSDPLRCNNAEYLNCRRFLSIVAEHWGKLSPQQQVELAKNLSGARHTVAFILIIESLVDVQRIRQERRPQRLRAELNNMKYLEEYYKPSEEMKNFLSEFKIIEKGVGAK